MASAAKKWPPTAPRLARIGSDDARVRFVDQRRGLEGLAGALVRQPPRGESAQLVVNQGKQVAGGLLLAPSDRVQDPGHLGAVGLAYFGGFMTWSDWKKRRISAESSAPSGAVTLTW